LLVVQKSLISLKKIAVGALNK